MSGLKFMAVVLAIGFTSTAVAQVTQQTQRDPAVSGQNQYNAAAANQAGQRAPSAQGQVGQAGRQAVAQQGTDMNTFLATCLLIGSQEEVALAQLAVDRAENEQVKQFAQMLIDDHQKVIQKLQPLAKPGIGLKEGHQAASASQSPDAQQPSTQQYTANRPNLESGADNSVTAGQILQLDQQAAQECLQMVTSMLQDKQGDEFDKAFTGMQIGAHVGMLAKLKVGEQHASGQLASLVKESQQTMQNHLEQAKQLWKELEGSASSRQASNN